MFEAAIEKIEERLGLNNQPRAIVFHEKEGRRHAHCVWSRIDSAEMKAINLPHYKMRLRDISRQLFLENDWRMPRGLQNMQERDPLGFSQAEHQQAKRTDANAAAIKKIFKECWAASDSAVSFGHALEEHGYSLARGDRRGHVAVDADGIIASWRMMQKIFVDSGSGNHYFRIMNDDAQIYIKLADAVTVTAGYPLRGSAEALDDGDVRLIQLKNTNPEGVIDWMEVASVSLPSKREPNWLTNEDVIFSARGTRTFAYPLDDVPPKTVCAPQFFVLNVRNTNDLSPHFLAWQINQKPAQDYFQRNATGSHILNIRRAVLEELTITVPNIQKQMMIVAFWQAAQRERSLLNSLIENRNSQLEALAAGLAPNGKEARI